MYWFMNSVYIGGERVFYYIQRSLLIPHQLSGLLSSMQPYRIGFNAPQGYAKSCTKGTGRQKRLLNALWCLAPDVGVERSSLRHLAALTVPRNTVPGLPAVGTCAALRYLLMGYHAPLTVHQHRSVWILYFFLPTKRYHLWRKTGLNWLIWASRSELKSWETSILPMHL